jgi:hypothetical protein
MTSPHIPAYSYDYGVLDPEFDEPPDKAELLEALARGDLNASDELLPVITSWENPHERYRRQIGAPVEPPYYKPIPLPLDIPAPLLIDHFLNSLEVKDIRQDLTPKPTRPPEYREPPQPDLEEILLKLRDEATMYEVWMNYDAKLKALRAAKRRGQNNGT